jgi:Na+-transporting methylmalonyl-CoA/oxaloacetate decarboxylase gamma subunit
MYSLLLAEVAEQKTISATLRFGDSVVFQLDGLAFVFIVLGLTWAAIAVLGVYFKRAAIAAAASAAATAAVAKVQPAAPVVPVAAPAPAVPAPIAPAAPVPAPITDLPPELVAVIAAAVQLTLRDAYRIHAIVPVAGHDWAHEGRRQIFASHQIR